MNLKGLDEPVSNKPKDMSVTSNGSFYNFSEPASNKPKNMPVPSNGSFYNWNELMSLA